MRSQIVKKIAAIVLCLYTGTVMFGQSSGGNNGPPAPSGDGPQAGPGLPIDDNIEILLFLGLLYGCYIVYKKYRIKNTAA
jgi:hypothetical protein